MGAADEIDSALQGLRVLLGTGNPPAPTPPKPPSSAPAWPDWTGTLSNSARGASQELDRLRTRIHSDHAAAMPIIARAGDLVTHARTRFDDIQAGWQQDKASLGSIADTPLGQLSLLSAGHRRLGEASNLIRDTMGEFVSAARNLQTISDDLPLAPPGQPGAPPAPAAADEQRRSEIAAFRQLFGRDPVTPSDWDTAAALDPNSYDPKNGGHLANIVVGRIKPVPGQGVVRTNLFIPSKDVWDPKAGVPPYDNNLGDNRGFSSTAGPEQSRVSIYTDFENGVIVARQNPSVNADTGEIRAGTPSISALQQPDGSVLIHYNAADPFSPGGQDLAKGIPISVNGTLGITPSDAGPRLGGQITSFPAFEAYSDRAGTTSTLLQSWPTFSDDASGPLLGLPFSKSIGDGTTITSFNSVIPQMPEVAIPSPHSLPQALPLMPPMSIVPPGNLTPLGSVAEAPQIRLFTPTFVPPVRPGG
jgi:hypothetical protein